MNNFRTEDFTDEELTSTLKVLLDHKEEFYAFEAERYDAEKQLISSDLWRYAFDDEDCWEELEELYNDPSLAGMPDIVVEGDEGDLTTEFIDSLCLIYAYIHKEAHFNSKESLKLKLSNNVSHYFFEHEGSVYGFASDTEVDGIYVSDYTHNGNIICMLESDRNIYMCTCGEIRYITEILKVYNGGLESFKRAVATCIYPYDELEARTDVINFLPFY